MKRFPTLILILTLAGCADFDYQPQGGYYSSSNALAAAAALGRPTRTGTIGESLGNAFSAYGGNFNPPVYQQPSQTTLPMTTTCQMTVSGMLQCSSY
jgi:hypothetical protein